MVYLIDFDNFLNVGSFFRVIMNGNDLEYLVLV